MISYSIGKSGLHAQQEWMNQTANDIANLSTTGYKSKQVAFRELINNPIRAEQVGVSNTAGNIGVTRGVKSFVAGNNVSQGSLVSSDSDYHVAITGEGFFGVNTPDGFRLTRDGTFHQDGTGTLVNNHGDPVAMTYLVPAGEWPQGKVTILENGEVSIQTDNGQTLLARIHVYQPESVAILQPTGRNQFRVGGQQVLVLDAGAADTASTIQHRMLETSNVDLAQTMVQMMAAQRAYSLNSKMIQTTDDLFSMVNQFNRT